jgi:hypothetical protein
MLTVHCLEIVAETRTPIALDTYCGSAIRGAFFRAIWGRFCTNRESPTCRECPLVMACPVATLVAPLRDEAISGRDVPRPYIISPPFREPNCYQRGERFTFSISLVGSSTKLMPYVIRALQEMEKSDLGHRLPELGGRRGQFTIYEIHAYHPLTGERQMLMGQGDTRPQKLHLCVTPADVAKHARQLPADHIALRFLSPTRLIFDEHLVKHPSFRVLALRLAERFQALQQAHGEESSSREEGDTGHQASGREQYQRWHQQIDEWASAVRLIDDETHWEDVGSYSSRQRKTTPIGGFIGRASYEGDITPIRELLVWGELLHVGKNVVKGNGIYRIEV